jgi:hypothetical protein
LNFSNSFKQKEEKRFLHQWMSWMCNTTKKKCDGNRGKN